MSLATSLTGELDFILSLSLVSITTSKILISFSSTLEIWDALRAAAEADLTLAQAIVDSAGVIVQSADLTICYDERGTYPFAFLPVSVASISRSFSM